MRANRDLWITIVARAVSLLGDEAALIVLTLRLHDGGSGAWWIAALFAAGMLPLVALAPIAGALVDRYDSRVLLVWSGLAQMAACLVLVQVQSISLVLVMVAAMGAGQAVNGATWQALLPGIVGTERLPAAMGTSQAVRDDPVLIGLLTTLAMFIVLGAMVNVIDVYLVRDTLHSSATWYGVLGGAWGAESVLSPA